MIDNQNQANLIDQVITDLEDAVELLKELRELPSEDWTVRRVEGIQDYIYGANTLLNQVIDDL